MADQPNTLARWYVVPSNEDAFVTAWSELAAVFLSLQAPPCWGTLLRSVEGPRLFSSFGPWPSMETIAAMRAHPAAAGAIGRLEALCAETEMGTYLVAATAGEDPQVT